jgi:DNA-directed RNA polymerase specialized sigma24 family protein
MERKKNQYVDNKKLYDALVEWLKDRKTAQKNKAAQMPPLPDYIGECILLMANRLAQKANFVNYTFKDDMIGDAMENCLRYLHNFNPTRSTNAFAYVTQILRNAFVRRITRERRNSYTKAVLISHGMPGYTVQDGDENDYTNTYVDFLQENVTDVIEKFESAKQRKKARQQKKVGLENFFVEEAAATEVVGAGTR